MEVHHHSHTERKKWTHYLDPRLLLKQTTALLEILKKEYHL